MRKYLVLAFTLIAALSFAASSAAFKKGEQTCTKCHTLSPEDAKKALDGIVPNIKIIHVEPGPFEGIWEIAFESNKQKSILYLDYSLKYLVARANIISIKDKKNLTEESFQKINKVDLTGFPYKNALVMGSKDAKHKIVVFDDPD